MTQSLLTIVASPALEETLADWMLARDDIPGFTSIRVDGHNTDTLQMSLTEQVRGRRHQVMYQAHLDTAHVEAILDDLHSDFSGARIHYWLTPIIRSGNLTSAPPAGELPDS
jgi:hypothetical protein